MAGFEDKVEEFVMDKLANIPKPSCDLTDVSVKNFTRSAVNLKSDVSVGNPYDHELPVLEITYNIRSNDKQITSGTIGDTPNVAANAATSIEVASEVAYDFLLDIMRDIGSDGDIDYDIDVSIKFNLPVVGSFNLPLHKTGCLKMPSLSDLL